MNDRCVSPSSTPVRQHIELSRIRDDGVITERSTETVRLYAEAMRSGNHFPPVDVVAMSDGVFVVIDGNHRIAAAKLNVGDGGTIEARVYSCPADMSERAFIEWLEVALGPEDWFDRFGDR